MLHHLSPQQVYEARQVGQVTVMAVDRWYSGRGHQHWLVHLQQEVLYFMRVVSVHSAIAEGDMGGMLLHCDSTQAW